MKDVFLDSFEGYPLVTIVQFFCLILLVVGSLGYMRLHFVELLHLALVSLLTSFSAALIGIYLSLVGLLEDFVWLLPNSSMKYSASPNFSYHDLVVLLFPIYVFSLSVLVFSVFSLIEILKRCTPLFRVKMHNHKPANK